MKTNNALIAVVLLLLLGTTAPAQNRVLATSQGYQLTDGDLRPVLELVVFLAQSQLTESEIQSIAGEAVEEFNSGPVPLLESLGELNQILLNAEATNDPMLLGELRQKLIAHFYQVYQSTPSNEMPAFLKILFQKAPVVAYDPSTNVALTRPDLEASVALLTVMNQYEENGIPADQMAMAGQELIRGFSELDAETQKLIASGTILNTILESNLQTMSPQQKTNVTSHYRTTTGGPPTRTTRGGGGNETVQRLSESGIRNTSSLMESLKASGGSDDYWKMQTGF